MYFTWGYALKQMRPTWSQSALEVFYGNTYRKNLLETKCARRGDNSSKNPSKHKRKIKNNQKSQNQGETKSVFSVLYIIVW